jgi:hypothetical protein
MILGRSGISIAAIALLAALAGAALPQPPADPVTRSIDATVEANRAARASQERVDKLDDATRALLERYRAASWQAQQLTAYAQQLDALVSAQDEAIASLRRQTEEMERTERELLPLMMRMLDGLKKFVALDLPFLATERKERLAALEALMADPSANNADKFRRLLEAWQIEAEYGRSLGSERAEVEGRAVDVLRLGRTALFYLSTDGAQAGVWDAEARRWVALPHRHVGEIRRGLRMARETAAPDLLRLPLPVAAGAAP